MWPHIWFRDLWNFTRDGDASLGEEEMDCCETVVQGLFGLPRDFVLYLLSHRLLYSCVLIRLVSFDFCRWSSEVTLGLLE